MIFLISHLPPGPSPGRSGEGVKATILLILQEWAGVR